MKLFPLLFEGDLGFNIHDLAVSRVDNTGPEFTLYDPERLKAIIEDDPLRFSNPRDLDAMADSMQCIAAWVEFSEPSPSMGNCSGAYYVAYSARNPKYRGAGQLLVKIASSMLEVPVTSDRSNSSSDSAKEMWDRLSDDPGMAKKELDNFVGYEDDDDVAYVDIDPKTRTATRRAGPRTPDPSDDCHTPRPVDRYLGSPDAYQSKMSTGAYQARHQQMLKWIKKETGMTPGQFEEVLNKTGTQWFHKLFESKG